MMLSCFRKAKLGCLILCTVILLGSTGCNLKNPPVFKAEEGVIEAEDCLLTSSVIQEADSYSGNKAVNGINKEGASLNFAYETDYAGFYDLSINYENNGEDGTLGLFINDHFFMKVNFPSGCGTITETITLKNGIDTIRFSYLPGDGDITLDSFNLSPSNHSISMIVVPHEDDEVLGFAGTIQHLVAQGDTVKVVLLTNGDYFSGDLGMERIKESMNALAVLGVDSSDIIVMGYGDFTLYELYNSSNPKEVINAPSGFSQTYGNPEYNLYDYHTLDTGSPADYTKQNLTSDLYNIIGTIRPDAIYTTSEFEWHPDHQYAFMLVKDTIEKLNKDSGYHTLLCESVIHGEDIEGWPEALEFDEKGNPILEGFTDPFPSGDVELDWNEVTKVTLTEEEAAIKLKSIDEYYSQNFGVENIPGNQEFNYAFCKSDEFYWIFEY